MITRVTTKAFSPHPGTKLANSKSGAIFSSAKNNRKDIRGSRRRRTWSSTCHPSYQTLWLMKTHSSSTRRDLKTNAVKYNSRWRQSHLNSIMTETTNLSLKSIGCSAHRCRTWTGSTRFWIRALMMRSRSKRGAWPHPSFQSKIWYQTLHTRELTSPRCRTADFNS